MAYRYGNGHIDTDLASFDLLLEHASCGTRASEDGGTVSVFVGVDEVDGLVNRIHVQADEHRSKDFLGVALHMRLDVGDDGRPDL